MSEDIITNRTETVLRRRCSIAATIPGTLHTAYLEEMYTVSIYKYP
jgi:hypothetical protein